MPTGYQYSDIMKECADFNSIYTHYDVSYLKNACLWKKVCRNVISWQVVDNLQVVLKKMYYIVFCQFI